MAKNVTQNGWTVINGLDLDSSPVPSTSIIPVPGLRKGDVAKVLLEVGRQFNATVAPLYNPGCWGYAPAIPIPGSTILSNHGSGTAIDFNAPSFPWKKRTMTDAQRQACRQIVENLSPVVAWGGDWTTVDEMHFEIRGNADEVKQVANKIIGVTMPTDKQIDETISTLHQDAYGKSPSDAVFDDWRKVLKNNYVEGNISILKGIDNDPNALKNKSVSGAVYEEVTVYRKVK